MSRELLLLRHGKSDWGVDTSDIRRPLKNRGKRGAQRIGIWLAQQQLIPDLILSSPAKRAFDTAQKCCKSMGIYTKQIQQDKRIYLADTDHLLAVLADCPAIAQRVLLVGHNPGFEDLLLYLSESEIEIPEDGKLMPTATIAVLTLPDNWDDLRHGQAKLKQLVRSANLRGQCP